MKHGISFFCLNQAPYCFINIQNWNIKMKRKTAKVYKESTVINAVKLIMKKRVKSFPIIGILLEVKFLAV